MTPDEKKLTERRVSVVTLGCVKNTADSESLLGQLARGGARIASDPGEADTVVINTCGFIEDAKRESLQAIQEAVEKKKRGEIRKIVVMGCLSERYKKELSAEIPEVDSFFGSDEMGNVLAALGIDYKKELLGERLLLTPSHFAYLKISEGCDNPCSFCAIPLMRGLHHSKPMDRVLAEAQSLAAGGVREIILIGQDTTYYGLDIDGQRRLPVLLEKLHEVEGLDWIRLMYAYPAKFPLELLDSFSALPKLCRYIDMPIQHVADPVLRSMRRGISTRALRELLETVSTRVPNIAIRTTLLVGYPEESEKDFDLLYDFVREFRFHRLGVFTYSQEDGTTAFDLGDPIPAAVKAERRNALMELQKGIARERNERQVGSRVRVLIDRKEDGMAVGRTEWDAPEIDQEVFVEPSDRAAVGAFADVEVTDATEYDLYATA